MLRKKQPNHASPLGRLISKRRRELNISIGELGRRSGIAKGMLSRLERGERDTVSLPLVDPLATALELPPSDLLTALGLPLDRQLPPLPQYLKFRYGRHLSPRAETELRHYLREFQHRHGITDWAPPEGRVGLQHNNKPLADNRDAA